MLSALITMKQFRILWHLIFTLAYLWCCHCFVRNALKYVSTTRISTCLSWPLTSLIFGVVEWCNKPVRLLPEISDLPYDLVCNFCDMFPVSTKFGSCRFIVLFLSFFLSAILREFTKRVVKWTTTFSSRVLYSKDGRRSSLRNFVVFNL